MSEETPETPAPVTVTVGDRSVEVEHRQVFIYTDGLDTNEPEVMRVLDRVARQVWMLSIQLAGEPRPMPWSEEAKKSPLAILPEPADG